MLSHACLAQEVWHRAIDLILAQEAEKASGAQKSSDLGFLEYHSNRIIEGILADNIPKKAQCST